MSRLGQLLVKCPACRSLYPSGIVTDFEMIQRDLDPDRTATTRCPFCGSENCTNLKAMAFVAATF